MSKRVDIQKHMIAAHPSRDKKFTRVYQSLLESAAFCRLHPYSQMLYIRMIGRTRGDCLSFTYPKSEYSKYMCASVFVKAKTELLREGFISEKKYIN